MTQYRALVPESRPITITWRRPDRNDERDTVPICWSGWGSIYATRWQYWPPWGVSEPWKPRVLDACDGERASKLVIVPLIGAFVWFFNRPCGHDEDAD